MRCTTLLNKAGVGPPPEPPTSERALTEILERGRPLGHHTHLVSRGYRCPVTSLGQGQPIICIHGLGHDQWDFSPLFERREDGFELLALDLPGFGLSKRTGSCQDDHTTTTSRLNLSTLVEAVEALINTCIVPPILLGSSLGGHVALEIGLKSPESVRGLLLVAPGGLQSHSPQERLELLSHFSTESIGSRTTDVIEAINSRIFHGSCRARAELAHRKLAQHESVCAPRYAATIASIVEDVLERPVGDRLGGLGCPVTFIFGAQDRVVPLQLGISAAQQINAPLHIIDESGHLPMVESPDTFSNIAFDSARALLRQKALLNPGSLSC